MIETITTPILPDVSIAIRYSEKAKFLQLRATASYIELIIPKKNTLSTRDIQNFLHIKHEWIAKQWLNVKEKIASMYGYTTRYN